MKFAICNEVYGDWPFEKAFAHAKAAGYAGLEIAPFTLAENVFQIDGRLREKVLRVARQNDLEIIGLHWLLAGTKGYHLTSPDKATRKRTTVYLKELASLCNDLGGRVMVLGSPNERNLPNDVSEQLGQEFAIETLEDLVPALESQNITLALEPLGPEETNFMNTAQSAIRIIEAIGSDKIRLHLDVKAMYTESEAIPEIIRFGGPYLQHFHANDPNRQGPGMGAVKYEPIMAALQDVGYDGWVSVEVFDYDPGIEKLVNGSIGKVSDITDDFVSVYFGDINQTTQIKHT